MKLGLLAVGQIRGTHEAPLYDDYATRIQKAGRGIGFDGLHLTELKEQAKATKTQAAMAAHLDRHDGLVVMLDEGGENWSSRQLADRLSDWRDTNRGTALFVIGPADGLDTQLKKRGDVTLSLGAMTWPHMLARVLLAEQLWRAISIMSGHPYHRD